MFPLPHLLLIAHTLPEGPGLIDRPGPDLGLLRHSHSLPVRLWVESVSPFSTAGLGEPEPVGQPVSSHFVLLLLQDEDTGKGPGPDDS